MKAQANALRELLELGRIELVIELGLARQNDAQHLVLGGLDAREQTHFLEHALRQVLRLIDHQHHLAASAVLLEQEIVERREQLRLLHVERLEAELHQHRLQELDRRHLRLVDAARPALRPAVRCRKVSISVVLPQPISPVITTKPSVNHTVDSM